MAKNDALQAVGRLMAAFRPDRVTEETVQVYVEHLSDIDPALLNASVDRILAKSKFFPVVSEIRRTALELSGLAAPSPAEAMAILRAADRRTPVNRRDGSYAYTLNTWEFPDGLSKTARDAVMETLSKVGEPCDENGKDHFGWETGFQKTYEIVKDEIESPMLSDMAKLRLPAPKTQTALPKPEPVQFQPAPDEQPIPTCVRCQKHMAFFDTPEGPVCGFCQRGQTGTDTLPGGDRE